MRDVRTYRGLRKQKAKKEKIPWRSVKVKQIKISKKETLTLKVT